MLVINNKEMITSLELVKQINIFRKEEGNKNDLEHKNLLNIIREEFGEEIAEGNIQQFYYKDSMNREKPMFNLTLSQAKQVLVRMKVKPTKEFCDKYNINVEYTINNKVRFELSFGSLLQGALDELDIKMMTQYNVDGYRIDFYLPEYNIAVEYDEEQHYTKRNMKLDNCRQAYIENKIGAEFIRCDYRDSDIKNVMKVIKRITGGK